MVVDLLLVLMVLVVLVSLLLVLVELMHLVEVQTKKQMDIVGIIQLVRVLGSAQQSGHKNLHIQMQYIFKVVVLCTHLITMVVVVLLITEVVVQEQPMRRRIVGADHCLGACTEQVGGVAFHGAGGAHVPARRTTKRPGSRKRK